MNCKKSRMLRKQAGGNDAEYMPRMTSQKLSIAPRMTTQKLSQNCSRKKYKDLKYLYKLVGI